MAMRDIVVLVMAVVAIGAGVIAFIVENIGSKKKQDKKEQDEKSE